MRLLNLLALAAGMLVLGLLAGRALDHEHSEQDRAVRDLQELACGFEQFEDYSVVVQPMDWARERCVAELGR